MSIKLRQEKNLKKKLIVYIFLLVLLGIIGFFINSIFFSQNAFISPIGKNNIDRSKVEKLLKINNISFVQVLVLADSYLIKTSNNGQITLSSQKDIGKQISSLQRILKQLTIEGKPFKSIDFRFLEPIVSF